MQNSHPPERFKYSFHWEVYGTYSCRPFEAPLLCLRGEISRGKGLDSDDRGGDKEASIKPL
jgi:hypothetical protein